jgi:hypothetical protein
MSSSLAKSRLSIKVFALAAAASAALLSYEGRTLASESFTVTTDGAKPQ